MCGGGFFLKLLHGVPSGPVSRGHRAQGGLPARQRGTSVLSPPLAPGAPSLPPSLGPSLPAISPGKTISSKPSVLHHGRILCLRPSPVPLCLRSSLTLHHLHAPWGTSLPPSPTNPICSCRLALCLGPHYLLRVNGKR